MSTDFRKLPLKEFPSLSTRLTPEAHYWRNFKTPVVTRHVAAVTSIDFSPAAPHDYAVTSSTRVQVYDGSTTKAKKTLSRFKDVAYSGTFRSDGRLLVAGGHTGLVQVFDLSSRSVLRSFAGHSAPVHVARFAGDNVHVMSGSDDATVRCWDVTTASELLKLAGHQDYVRAGAVGTRGALTWVTGSYDHTVRLWDAPRSADCTMTLDHGAPVEALLIFPSGALVLSAGGNMIKVWDVIGGGRLRHELTNHQKTVTSLCLAADGARFVSGALDHMVKVYDVTDFSVAHTIKYSAPVLAVAISADSRRLAVGMSDGLVSVRSRTIAGTRAAAAADAERSIFRGGSYRYFLRGRNSKPALDDYRVEARKRVRLRKYDRFLKKFEYHNALDAALETGQAVVIATVVDELMARDGLGIALQGRDDVSLKPLLAYIARNITTPRYASLLNRVLAHVLDIYGPMAGQSPLMDEQLTKIQRRLTAEVDVQRGLLALVGAMDLLFAASTSPASAVPQTPLPGSGPAAAPIQILS